MSIKTFSDFPYYMIYDYFSELKKYYNVEEKYKDDIIQLYNDVVFEEPWIDFHFQEDFLDFGNYYNRRESSVTKIRLRGPRTNIIAKGGEYTTFYAKIDDYGYKSVDLRPLIDEEWIDENWFMFDKKEYDYKALGIFTQEEIEKIIQEIEEIKKVIVDQYIENNKLYVGERVEGNKYCAITHISTNDEELSNKFDENRGNILDNKIEIKESVLGKTHALKVWRKKDVNEEIKLSPENELYLRKDSFFFKWFKKELKYLGNKATNNGLKVLTDSEKENSTYFLWNHENYINDNLLFSFFGCTWPIWPVEDKWKVYHRGMKDFMIEAIPENDMGLNLKAFTWENFDRIYQEVYNMQKNVYTLLDPEEVYEKYLGFLALFYDIDLDKFQVIPEENKRWYIKNLPYFLKKKGAWTSLWISWQCIIDKNNDIQFYERWHLRKKITKQTLIDIKQNEVIDV